MSSIACESRPSALAPSQRPFSARVLNSDVNKKPPPRPSRHTDTLRKGQRPGDLKHKTRTSAPCLGFAIFGLHVISSGTVSRASLLPADSWGSTEPETGFRRSSDLITCNPGSCPPVRIILRAPYLSPTLSLIHHTPPTSDHTRSLHHTLHPPTKPGLHTSHSASCQAREEKPTSHNLPPAERLPAPGRSLPLRFSTPGGGRQRPVSHAERHDGHLCVASLLFVGSKCSGLTRLSTGIDPI